MPIPLPAYAWFAFPVVWLLLLLLARSSRYWPVSALSWLLFCVSMGAVLAILYLGVRHG